VNISVLASHGGSTLQAVLDAISNHELNATVGIVISNNSRCGAMTRAKLARVPTAHISGVTHPDACRRDAAIRDTLLAHAVDLVLLAGYMKALGPATLHTFDGRIINTHPSMLPKFGGAGFYGLKVHEAVLAAGETMTGASVHLVHDAYDTGPVIAQREVAVQEDDTPETLQARVKAVEQDLLLSVLREWPGRSTPDTQAKGGV